MVCCKNFGVLILTVLSVCLLLACTSTRTVELKPEEVSSYSDTECVNARIINDEYVCFEHDWAESVEAVGLENLKKVSSEYYRSAQPESGGFASAEKLGIKTIISLRESDSDNALAEKEPTSIKLIHIPLSTLGITQEDVGRVLNVIRKAEKPVLVHCRHGSDRTGLITAYYRIIFENWQREEARAELLFGGFGHHTIFSNIPKLVLNGDLEVIKALVFEEQENKE